jgi:hypothetical protein
MDRAVQILLHLLKINGLMEDAGGERPRDFQNLHRNKRAMSLNLKDPGTGRVQASRQEGRCRGREFSAQRR